MAFRVLICSAAPPRSCRASRCCRHPAGPPTATPQRPGPGRPVSCAPIVPRPRTGPASPGEGPRISTPSLPPSSPPLPRRSPLAVLGSRSRAALFWWKAGLASTGRGPLSSRRGSGPVDARPLPSEPALPRARNPMVGKRGLLHAAWGLSPSTVAIALRVRPPAVFMVRDRPARPSSGLPAPGRRPCPVLGAMPPGPPAVCPGLPAPPRPVPRAGLEERRHRFNLPAPAGWPTSGRAPAVSPSARPQPCPLGYSGRKNTGKDISGTAPGGTSMHIGGRPCGRAPDGPPLKQVKGFHD